MVSSAPEALAVESSVTVALAEALTEALTDALTEASTEALAEALTDALDEALLEVFSVDAAAELLLSVSVTRDSASLFDTSGTNLSLDLLTFNL
jgi:hypothetical protein